MKKLNRELNKYNFAFTLSEVLITLAIIGVVAALTIPTLIANQKKATTLSQLKKAYATLNNMYDKAVAENGPIDNWGLKTINGSSSANMLTVYQNILAPNLQVAKDCGTTNTNYACWAYGYDWDGTPNAAQPTWAGVYTLLADGTSLVLDDNSNTWSGYQAWIIRFYVDLNGLRGPNRWGKDRFIFYVDNSGYSYYKITPRGTVKGGIGIGNESDRRACWDNAYSGGDTGGAGTGVTCSHTIITKDNWQIADDYEL